MNPDKIVFYFDPISPYAWLASSQLASITHATKRQIIAKPILFAGLLKAHGHLGPAEIPAKRDYIFRDVMRRARRYGLEMSGPPKHPFNSLLALRICTAIETDEKRLQFAVAVMRAAWEQGLDITDTAVISQVCTASDIDSGWALSAAQNPDVKNALIVATDEAVKLGLFGVPSFMFDKHLYWGDDRIDDLIYYANTDNIDEQKLAHVLAREAAATRKI